MKLSEAMRAGYAQVGRSTTNAYYAWGDGDEVVAVCALGAAMMGLGVRPRRNVTLSFHFLEQFPALGRALDPDDQPRALLDQQGQKRRGLEQVIYLLNDDLGWTISQIADWLEGLGE